MWSRVRRATSWLAPAGLLVAACQASVPEQPPTGAGVSSPTVVPASSATYFPPPLCARPGSDPVRDVFCAAEPPATHGLIDLERVIGLAFPDAYYEARQIGDLSGASGTEQGAVVFIAHSTSLSGDLVSPINPRAMVFDGQTFLAFTRGVQQVEVATVDRTSDRVKFYLFRFRQACNDSRAGCGPGDLFTPRVETGWASVRLDDDEDLKNTPQDCRQCHQRGTDQPLRLMRELDGPWTHFFAPDQGEPSSFPEPSGRDLLHDYVAAKGDEIYAGVPSILIRITSGFTLEGQVDFPQPLVFDGSTISNERWPFSPTTGYATQPVRSATWDAAFAAFQRGEQLALPFYAPRATDAGKQTRLTDAYARYASGQLEADALPDLADIFPDDASTRAEIGLQTVPAATPAGMLIQACGPCHNDRLDQTVSRARFNIALSRLDPSERDVAIARLTSPRDSTGSMPPPGRRQVDPGALSSLVDYLRKGQRSTEDDALLERASSLGMISDTPQ